MNRKKLLAMALALVLATAGTGMFAYAQSDDGAPAPLDNTQPVQEEVQPEAPVQEEEGVAPQGLEVKPTGETSNVVIPGAEAAPTSVPVEEEPAPVEQPSEEPLVEEPTAEPVPEEQPSEEPPVEEPTAEPVPEEQPSEEPPVEESTDEPAPVPELPTEVPFEEDPTPQPWEINPPVEEIPSTPEAPAYVAPYAYVPSGTSLFRDKARQEKLGQLLADTVMLVQRHSVYENGGVLYEAYFVTDQSLQDGGFEVAYFYSTNLPMLSQAQCESYLASGADYKVDGKPVLPASIQYYRESAGDPNESHVNKPDVNVRCKPDASSRRIAQLEKGENVQVKALVVTADGEWYHVVCNGRDGYIRADLVTLVGSVPRVTEDGQPIPEETPIPDPTEPPASDPTATPDPEAPTITVEEPTEEPAEEPTEEPAEEPTPEPVPQNITVNATCDTSTLQLGSRITLTATLEGYDGLDYTCCWQYAAADRDGNIVGEWKDAQADTLTHSYTLTEDNLLTAWRMCVTLAQ